jgi:hypothetical protein
LNKPNEGGTLALARTLAHPGGALNVTCHEVLGDFQVVRSTLMAIQVGALG